MSNAQTNCDTEQLTDVSIRIISKTCDAQCHIHNHYIILDYNELPLFTEDDFNVEVNKLKKVEAPGANRIPADVLKIAVEKNLLLICSIADLSWFREMEKISPCTDRQGKWYTKHANSL